jgi:DhnA family fructose-bisphosphate aldolase class Ia
MKMGQDKRLYDFVDAKGNSLIVEVTKGLYGIEYRNIGKILDDFFKKKIDAVILSPGEARKHYDKFKSRSTPALIIRTDWSNYLLDAKSAYPSQKFRHVSIATASESLRIGASAVIMDLFYGVDDCDNVENIQMLRKLCEEGADLGLPVIANIIPFGSRINSNNYNEVILLGMRVALELGATGAAIPIPHSHGGVPLVESSIGCPLFVNSYQSPYEPIIPSDYAKAIKNMRILGINGVIIDGFNKTFSIEEISSFIYETKLDPD